MLVFLEKQLLTPSLLSKRLDLNWIYPPRVLAACVEVWGNVAKCDKRKKFRNRLFMEAEKHSLRTKRSWSSMLEKFICLS